MKKIFDASFNLSLVFGALAAVLSLSSVYGRILMLLGFFCGFLGFGLCCLHIVISQRENEGAKLSSTPKLLLSLFLNTTPLLSMAMLIWLAKHGK